MHVSACWWLCVYVRVARAGEGVCVCGTYHCAELKCSWYGTPNKDPQKSISPGLLHDFAQSCSPAAQSRMSLPQKCGARCTSLSCSDAGAAAVHAQLLLCVRGAQPAPLHQAAQPVG